MASNPKKIFIMATKMEAEPFISGLNLAQVEAAPVPVFQNQGILLVISGIGKANAAMATTYSCVRHSPALICNTGAAGAVDASLNLGDVFQVSEIFEFDRPKLRSGELHSHKPATISGIKTAPLATQDKPAILPGERSEIAQHVQLVDMEAASITQVCRKFDVCCYVFKFVSDTPQHTHGNDIVANIKKYRDTFFSYFSKNILPKI